MKSRFTSIDIVCCLAELRDRLIGMRVNQVYDIDNKTYLIRLQRQEEKAVLLFESGIRIHTTSFEWPKNPAPSGFSMKLRKHLNNKRLESIQQLGRDRVVDMQFGTGEAAYHVIVELYDRGNIVLTDYNYLILNILRPRTEGEDTKFAVKEHYPIDKFAPVEGTPSVEKISEFFANAKQGENLKKYLVPNTEYGPALIEHILLEAGFPPNCRYGKDFNPETDLERLHTALGNAEAAISAAGTSTKGYVVQKAEKRPSASGTEEVFLTNQEFHPMLFAQYKTSPHAEFATFNEAVDEFFSKLESQKLDLKIIHQERDAMKKLDNIRQDHEKRLKSLQQAQQEDEEKARLIELNQPIVDHAIKVVRSALANQLPWKDIEELVAEATERGDPVAKLIKKLKLESNQITLLLSDPFDDEEDKKHHKVDVNLDLTAFANARKYFDQKRNAAKKENKTLESSEKAFKSAEKKAKQTLKESATLATIRKARKAHWFEKFFWFISSDNYLVVGGRDRQQNELIVKRYLKAGDVYVHADLHGASSVIIKNAQGIASPIPPRTLQEAGLMAVCYSAAWEAKVVTAAWWVEAHQVSKTAPSGEYLTTGSFMIRGKKNYLPPIPLVLGFGLLFKLEESSISRHLDERKAKALEDESAAVETVEEVAEDLPVENEESGTSDEDEREEYEKSVENARSLLAASQLTENSPELSFPDTVVDIGLRERTRTSSSAVPEEETYTIIGDIAPSAGLSRNPEAQGSASKPETSKKAKQQELQAGQQQQPKRGQKGKLKKIKEKYKDQDEEERLLRMEILQSAGAPKEKGKDKKKGKDGKTKTKETKTEKAAGKPEPKPKPSVKQDTLAEPSVAEEEENDAEDDNAQPADSNVLNSLTGQPVAEDELLYAIPVVAPYSTLSQYKFKVKVIPGQNKRGKAVKTALSAFLLDKAASSREKDLIKGLKDQDVARNLPGRVKLAMPQSQKAKK